MKRFMGTDVCIDQIKAFVGRGICINEIRHSTELEAFPRFFRFNTISLSYNKGAQGIEEKCQSFLNYLRPIKGALIGANVIYFIGRINYTIFEHLHNHLLPIFGHTCSYKFDIECYCPGDVTNLISSILKIPQINRCRNVSFDIVGSDRVGNSLPVESISNWLNQKLATEDGVNWRKRCLRWFSDQKLSGNVWILNEGIVLICK